MGNRIQFRAIFSHSFRILRCYFAIMWLASFSHWTLWKLVLFVDHTKVNKICIRVIKWLTFIKIRCSYPMIRLPWLDRRPSLSHYPKTLHECPFVQSWNSGLWLDQTCPSKHDFSAFLSNWRIFPFPLLSSASKIEGISEKIQNSSNLLTENLSFISPPMPMMVWIKTKFNWSMLCRVTMKFRGFLSQTFLMHWFSSAKERVVCFNGTTLKSCYPMKQ